MTELESYGKPCSDLVELVYRVQDAIDRQARDQNAQACAVVPDRWVERLRERPTWGRNQAIFAERTAGATYQRIGQRYGLTKERIRQLVQQVNRVRLWEWRHPEPCPVIRGRTMLDDEDGR